MLIQISTFKTDRMSKGNILSKALSPVYHFSNWRRRKQSPMYNRTILDLLETAGINVDDQSDRVKERLSWHVSHICTVGYRFYKNCVCVQYFDDTDKEMKWAYENGAILLITKKQIDELPCVVVPEPLVVYAKLCNYYRSLTPISATAVVGSIGKTTTKEMIRSVFNTHYKTFAEPTNDNLTCAVGFYSQHISKRNQIILQEISEDKPGGIEVAAEILRPHIAVITELDQSHIIEYGSKERIKEDVCSICKFMTDDDFVIYNKDSLNPEVFIKYRSRTVSVSKTDTTADIYATDITVRREGITFTINDKESKLDVGLNNIYAEHNVTCALFAYAAGMLSGVPAPKIRSGIMSFKTRGIRQNIFRVKNNVVVYADCYNAVAKSVQSAIMACHLIPMGIGGEKIAVLGDIEEAGNLSDQTHLDIIKMALSSDFSKVFLFGPKMLKAHEALTQKKIEKEVRSYTDIVKLNRDLKETIHQNDLVLFKSSRKSRLERCIKHLWPRTYWSQLIHEKAIHLKWRLKMMVE